MDAAHRRAANGFVFALPAFPKFEYKLAKRTWNSHWIWLTSSHNSIRFAPAQLSPNRLVFFNWLNGKAMYRLDAEAVSGSEERQICNEPAWEHIISPLVFIPLLECNLMSLHPWVSARGMVGNAMHYINPHVNTNCFWFKAMFVILIVPQISYCYIYTALKNLDITPELFVFLKLLFIGMCLS